MPRALRITYTRGVTPGRWARTWGERFPRAPLELAMTSVVIDVVAQLTTLRDGSAELAFVRLPANEDGEPSWPGGARPDDIHFVALYRERAFALAPAGSVLEAADEVTVAEVEGETGHPFDDDIAATVEVVAANVGVVIVPQSIARLYARKDLVTRPVEDLPGWCVGLAWLRAGGDARIDDFVGVVRGRTANSSRGAVEGNEPGARERSAKRTGKPAASATSEQPTSTGRARQNRQGPARPSRGARKGRRSTR